MYINEGNLNFKKTIIYQGARGLQVRDVVTDDIDKDGDIDVLFGEGIDDNKLLINDGKASFSDFGKLTNSNFFNPLWTDAVVADVDNDGQKDILTWNNYSFPELTLMKAFLERVEIDDLERGNGGELLVADFDKNGFLDIVVQSYSTNTVYILYQSARLQFRTEILDANWNNSSVTIEDKW
ncbi:MAG: VCBS repeat-containing protein [Haliscomenobacter sp.]|nr:VCBS repeat-containing protein [Haliscomenobacter sp.]MBK9487462.1 VCBS repeat-containing protein [Haliscomenobacter sp.]